MAKKHIPCDKPASLMLKTQELLKASDETIMDICIGTRIPYHWLQNFHKDIGNPGVNRIETLYQYLSGEQLKL